MLEELLYDVVPKDILHQLERVCLDLVKHAFLLVAIGRLDLLLDEPGAVLITAKLDNVTVYVLWENLSVIHKSPAVT